MFSTTIIQSDIETTEFKNIYRIKNESLVLDIFYDSDIKLIKSFDIKTITNLEQNSTNSTQMFGKIYAIDDDNIQVSFGGLLGSFSIPGHSYKFGDEFKIAINYNF
jgi:hypothetical protein